MSYAEIAKELSISVKTVENQISKALKILRREIYKKSSFE
jgi:DNA-directed RNA polymerase specialized sigma24 family protein